MLWNVRDHGARGGRGGGGMTRLLLVAAALVVALAAAGVGAGAEWHVNPGDGTPIQDAIDGAEPGDTIYVHAGAYIENLNVGKRLTLVGDGADVVTVTADDASDDVLYVTADWANISGFMVTGATDYWRAAGICLCYAHHCNISENNVSNNNYGIHLSDSINNTLHSNTANSNNDYGIYLSGSINNTLHSNIMSGNRYNFGIYGCPLSDYAQNIDASNMVDGKPIYYLVDQQDKQIPDNAGFVGVVNSTNIIVRNLTLMNNMQGVLFVYSDNSRIENVTASDNGNGIYLYYSSNNMLSGNNASNNSGDGIFIGASDNNTLASNTANSNDENSIRLWCSDNNTLANNNVANNGVGIYLAGSSNNTLSDNTVKNNAYGICLGYSNNCHNTIVNNIFLNNGLFVSGNYNENTVENNIVNGRSLVYLKDMSNFTIQNAGQVILVNCTNITVKNLNLSNASFGIYLDRTDDCKIMNNIVNSNSMIGICLWGSKNNTLRNNTASNNYRGVDSEDLSGTGVYLVYSSNNTMTSNNVSNNCAGIIIERSTYNMIQNTTANSNNWCGILLWSSNDNTLIDNSASNNSHGIHMWSLSNNNTLYHNSLINNTDHNAYDDSTNQWDSGTEGNYYSDYTGTDNNTDGIGDDPHLIPGGTSTDRFPLMQQWSDTPLKGDLNGDDQITPADAAIALQIAATGGWNADADVSGDGSVTSLDALMILQVAAGTREYPIAGCRDLDQNILRMYDENRDGLIDDDWMLNAGIDLEYGRITQSEYYQVKYAYEHKCPVEPAE